MMRYIAWFIPAILLSLIVTACAQQQPGGGGAPAGSAGEAQVTMQDVSFQPQELNVQPGATITWTNEDDFAHTVTAGTRANPSGLFDSGNVAAGDTFSFTFEEAGTYEYFCSLHDGMRGVIVVGEGDGGASQSGEGPSGGTDDGGLYDY